jgi:tetratricopeptide (TPR) repeat protein
MAMDCRLALCVGCVLAIGLVGCGHDNQFIQPGGTEVTPPVAKIAPHASQLDFEADQSPDAKHLKPGTLVALGDFRLMTAKDPARTPDERAQLLEDARAAYIRAVSLDANCLMAHLGLARYWDLQNQPDKSIASYDTALKLAPHDAGLWFEAGTSLVRRNEWDAALERLRKAAEMKPDNRVIVSAYAVALVHANRAEESLSWMMKVYPEGEARLNLARTLHHMEADNVARAYLEQALKIDPTLKGAQDLLVQMSGTAPPVPVIGQE